MTEVASYKFCTLSSSNVIISDEQYQTNVSIKPKSAAFFQKSWFIVRAEKYRNRPKFITK